MFCRSCSWYLTAELWLDAGFPHAGVWHDHERVTKAAAIRLYLRLHDILKLPQHLGKLLSLSGFRYFVLVESSLFLSLCGA